MRSPILAIRPNRPSPAVEILTIVAAAALATQVKTLAESALQPLGERLFPPTEAESRLAGADPSDHPDNMPPHVLLDKASAAVGDDHLDDSTVDAGSQAVHWATGIGAGLVYGLLARRFPVVRAGRGTAFGAVLFAGTHGSLLPAIGIQGSLSSLPRSWWVWEPGSHLIFGATLDTAIRAGEAAYAEIA